MVNNVKKFQLSETYLDVFLTNYLCPLCDNQSLMCPERCNETVIGCVLWGAICLKTQILKHLLNIDDIY